ncbi:hypothetical protein [Natronococcus roseus]|uniref:hypothetical protein n=1 Tax=Natronococcus roseus TaxID=1052014 RepID=UPI00374DB508
MTRFNRRKLLASGAALGVTGLFGSLSTAADEHGEEAETQDVDVEYEYRLEGEGDDEQLEERLDLSSVEYHYVGDEDEPQTCYVTFSAENVSDDEIRVDFWATVDGHSTWDVQRLLDPGESGGERLESLNPDNCPTDPDQVTITARSPYIGDPHEPPEDDEGEDGDVEFEYTYTVEQGDDEQLEERLELSSGEFDSCTVEADAENLSDDESISFYRHAVVDGNPTHESVTSLDPGESDSISMDINQGVADECPDDPDQATVHTWVASIGESDEPPEDEEDEEAEPQDVEVEYVYEIAENAYGDDEHVEERLELSSGEYYLDEQEDSSNYCYIEFEAENVTDDEAITIYFEGRVNDNNTHERPEELEPGESISLSLRGIEECPADPDLVEVRAWVPHIGELDEPPEDDEDEEEADEEPEDEEEADDDEPTDKADLDLSVSAPDSIPYEETAEPSEDAADFCITVTNHGDEAVSVDGQFEIGPIDEPLPLDLEPDETETAHYGVMSRDLGPGDHDWTVTANGETETGTLTVTDDEEC